MLIVDEPTKGLNAAMHDQVVGLLQAVLSAGGAVLVITHDVGVPRALGGQVAVMRDAQTVEMGACDTVLQAPVQAYTQALLAAEPACWPEALERPVGALAPPRGRGPLVQAQGLTQRFGPNTVFDDLSLQVHAGERVAITGPSGSGKTTLGNVLLGLVQPTAGQVTRGHGLGPQAFQKLYHGSPGRLCAALGAAGCHT